MKGTKQEVYFVGSFHYPAIPLPDYQGSPLHREAKGEEGTELLLMPSDIRPSLLQCSYHLDKLARKKNPKENLSISC